MSTIIVITLWILGLVTYFLFLYIVPLNLWLTSIFSGIWTTPNKLIAMKIKQV